MYVLFLVILGRLRNRTKEDSISLDIPIDYEISIIARQPVSLYLRFRFSGNAKF